MKMTAALRRMVTMFRMTCNKSKEVRYVFGTSKQMITMFKKACNKSKHLMYVSTFGTSKQMITMFKKACNKNKQPMSISALEAKLKERKNYGGDNSVTPGKFNMLISRMEVHSKRQAFTAKRQLDTLIYNKNQGVELLIKLEELVDILKDFTKIANEIDTISLIHGNVYKEYMDKDALCVDFDSRHLTGPLSIDMLSNRLDTLSRQLQNSYSELYDMMKGRRHINISAGLEVPLNTNGVLVLVERILSSDSSASRAKGVLKLESLVKRYSLSVTSDLNVRKNEYVSEDIAGIRKAI